MVEGSLQEGGLQEEVWQEGRLEAASQQEGEPLSEETWQEEEPRHMP